jgi:hypothetical protein
MKNTLVNLLLISLALFSCKSPKEKIIVDFLNNTKEKFDRKEFELVSIQKTDTLYELNEHFLNLYSFNKLGDGFNAIDGIEIDSLSIDTAAVNIEFVYKPWLGRYSSQLLEVFYANNFVYENNRNNFFLNDTVANMSTEEFSNLIIKDVFFKKKLKMEMGLYDNFIGAFSVDSLDYYLYKEIEKSKKIIGYIYNIKFREKSQLQNILLIFDVDDREIIGYKFVTDNS